VRTIRTAVSLLLLICAGAIAQDAQKVPIQPKQYRVQPATGAIRVDGILDEPAWASAEPMEFDVETNPGDNIVPPARTAGYMTYDSRHLYVAFRAWDPDPKAIRAHLSDRDNAFSDDFVGVVLDTFNDNRRAFEFFVNPLGVQMDLTMDDVNRNEDSSWDTIWESAGRITDEGYIVEMAIPFTSLRFPSLASEQTWGVDMVRVYPRSSRHRLGLQGQDRNRNCYLCQSSRVTGFAGITPGRDVELDPTLTAQQTARRESFPRGALAGGDTNVDLGLTGRWGITPNLQLTGAINPDFSQIEADAVQLDINTQFALSYAEKRPFFLEGIDFFEGPLPLIYTRSVADPSFGLKLTGRIGKSTLGAYVTEDELTNVIVPGAEGSSFAFLDQENTAAAFRYHYNVGETSTIGATLTSRDGTDYSNRVSGFDGTFRVTGKDTVIAQVLHSTTSYPDALAVSTGQPLSSFDDFAGEVRYRHSSRYWYWGGHYRDIGEDFRADSGFMPQVGYRAGNAVVEYNGWGEQGKTWYTRYWFGAGFDRAEKKDGELLEEEIEGWAAFQGPLQSFAQITIGDRQRRFNEVTFDEKFLHWDAELRPTGDFYLFARGTFADQIDFANTQLGERFVAAGGIRWNIGVRTKIDLEQTHEDLDVEGGRLFAADVTQLRAVYNIDLRTFVRAILQYTDIARDPVLYRHQTVSPSTQRLFPQLLFSYTINPQTVFFAGYSGTTFGGTMNDPITGESADVGLTEADRTFFIKIGYAWLF
jgi:hypothetical protein